MVGAARQSDQTVKRGGIGLSAGRLPRVVKAIDDGEPGNPKADRLTDVLGLQGVVQDSSKVLALRSTATGVAGHMARHVNSVVMGQRLLMGPALRRGLRTVARATPMEQKILRPLLATGQATARFGAAFGRYGPIISIPFAFYDVYKAVAESEPVKKRAASANAVLTVLGTAVGTAGVLVASVPVAASCLAVSAGVGLFQLVDAYANQGRTNQWLGDRLFGWMRG